MDTVNNNQDEHFYDMKAFSQMIYRPGITIDESQALYNKWAALGTYDQLHADANYFNSYDQIMAAMLELFPSRRDVSILDVGSGTGIVGQKLYDEGFHTLDALDPSTEMLKVSAERKVYRRYICSFFTQDPIDDIENDTYDVLLMCGVCSPGAIQVEAFKEAIRIVKPGGYIINCMRAEYLQTMAEYNGRWETHLNRLVNEGKWTLVSEHRYPNHFYHHEGMRLIHQVL
ncbi:malonyl-[acyl-carrier protein] O-methyltransferase-like [Babylonia areolata]|uniref:malonyl-[acyl-carrier protein] O-methyltransferase-like n=1 Tax=Babylonia areolata TaxID=304850 RepID=UPI003FD18DF8